MKISVTGTFSVPRNVLEKTLKDAGHEVVGLSRKTDILFIGEKTASASKIAKAEKLGIQRVVREIDPQKILLLIKGSAGAPAYVSMYKRYDDIEAGKTITVGVHNVVEVYSDFVDWNRDEGEWEEEDIKRAMTALTGGNGTYISPNEVEKILLREIGVEINPNERIMFLTGFYRLCVLDLLPSFIDEEGDGMECKVKEITSSELLSDEFYSKVLDLLVFCYDEEDKQEVKRLKVVVSEFIQKRKAEEKDVG